MLTAIPVHTPPPPLQMPQWKEYRPLPHSSVVGQLRVMDNVYSPQLQNFRHLLVYLPPSYHSDLTRNYPVLYMHDGQNLFDRATSFAGEWQVDETMARLSKEGIEAIVVGIPNKGKDRLDEYSPFRDEQLGGGKGDAYVDFIAHTIKPMIDRDFRTKREQPNTGIMGSSMGGLISLYAFFKYPEIFGFTGAMSPALWFADSSIFPYIETAQFVSGKIYLDAGTREYASFFSDLVLLRARSRHYYGRIRHMKRILVNKGYRPIHHLMHIEESGAMHAERAWARRLPEALRFLLTPLK